MDRVLSIDPFLVTVAVDSADDSTLVRSAQRRDVRAFEYLYRRHVARVHAVCLRLTADVRRAEDLTQSTFIQAWEKLPSFRGESAFGSWVHRLAVNTALMEFRATRRRESRVVAGTDEIVHDSPARVSPAGLRLDLEQAIAALPPQARAIFVLFDIEGYTHAEIADLMQLEIGTTKAQLHRARQLLQEALR